MVPRRNIRTMSVTINGVTYEGNNIKVINNKVWINGKRIENAEPDKKGILQVKVTGTLHNLEAGGSVICDDVTGDIDAGGSVQAGNVAGSIDAGGSVQCENVGGNVDAGGSVHYG